MKASKNYVRSGGTGAEGAPGGVVRFDAAAVVGGDGGEWSPGSVLVEGRGLVLAVGEPGEVDRHPAAARARRVKVGNAVVMPGLVNAHTHMDLTHLGARKHRMEDGFVPWVDMVRMERHWEEERIAESVRRGIGLLRAGGTVAVGDIAGAPRGRASLAPFRELAAAGMMGVSYLEFFGIGSGGEVVRERLEEMLLTGESPEETPLSDPRRASDHLSPLGAGRGRSEEREPKTPLTGSRGASNHLSPLRAGRGRVGGMRLGMQPHAPNTVGIPLYEWAAGVGAGRGVPLATHLAETVEEREFVGAGTGPQRELLERLGVWEEGALEHVGRGKHPVEHLAGVLGVGRFVAAHVNDADDAAIETLARTGTVVAYCPRASEYFGAERHFGGHRYREMLEAGVVVALGTDSIVNLPEAAADEGRGGMSVLDEMRLVHRRDRTDARVLLRMGTVNGAVGLGLDPAMFRIETGNVLAGLVAVEVAEGDGTGLERALRGNGRAVLLFPEN